MTGAGIGVEMSRDGLVLRQLGLRLGLGTTAGTGVEMNRNWGWG